MGLNSWIVHLYLISVFHRIGNTPLDKGVPVKLGMGPASVVVEK